MHDVTVEPTRQEYIFALDIGTRSVIGMVGKQKDGLFEVLATRRVEHNRRTMFDGQIEDIDQVAQVCGIVKTQLEQELDITLTNVCVAAAGRALSTCRASFELETDPEEPMSAQNIYQIEMGAIGIAQDEVNSKREDPDQNLFCVGYSVMGYYLDDYKMTTILGHKGRMARVELIATFLPNQVVDSLRSAMSTIGLNIVSLTLEPIAAMNAVIPSELRLLNLALVDIGAGTSDIAISNSGSVTAYTMATTAGDEITESLMRRYLVDFATAEALKRAAGTDADPVDYTDILGFEYSLSHEELLEALNEPVSALAEEICTRILDSNRTPPVAVFLVGGGSKTPLLGGMVAERLGIDIKKVSVGGSAYMKKQTSGSLDASDPEFATPLGIALTASFYTDRNSVYVYVNDSKVYMLPSSGFTVMNALLMCGYKYNQLMGKSGRSVEFRLGGNSIVARGGRPSPAEITVNDKPASLAAGLECGDKIIIMPSSSGADAQPKVGDYMKTPEEQMVTVDGIPYPVGELAMINGKLAKRDRLLENDDEMETIWINSLEQLTTHLGMLTQGRHFTVNGSPAELSDLLKDGDVIISEDDDYRFPQAVVWEPVGGEPGETTDRPAEEEATETVAETVAAGAEETASITNEFGELDWEAAFSEKERESGLRQQGPSMTVTLNQRQIELFPKEDKTPYLFVDMLNYVDIDPTKPEGDIVLRVNGQNASYLQEIRGGDTIQIYWSQSRS